MQLGCIEAPAAPLESSRRDPRAQAEQAVPQPAANNQLSYLIRFIIHRDVCSNVVLCLTETPLSSLYLMKRGKFLHSKFNYLSQIATKFKVNETCLEAI